MQREFRPCLKNQGHTKKFPEILDLYPFSFPNKKLTNIPAYPIFHADADTQVEAGEWAETISCGPSDK